VATAAAERLLPTDGTARDADGTGAEGFDNEVAADDASEGEADGEEAAADGGVDALAPNGKTTVAGGRTGGKFCNKNECKYSETSISQQRGKRSRTIEAEAKVVKSTGRASELRVLGRAPDPPACASSRRPRELSVPPKRSIHAWYPRAWSPSAAFGRRRRYCSPTLNACVDCSGKRNG
jgi:hypothetical protein